MHRFIEVSSYNDMVSGSNKMIEGVISVFGILIAISAVVSIVISIILTIKAKRKMQQNIDKMVDNITKESRKENYQHKCSYCGQLINSEEYCPACGAKQTDDE